jgi:hypothetical protein
MSTPLIDIPFLRERLRNITAICPDFDGMIEEQHADELESCLKLAKAIAGQALASLPRVDSGSDLQRPNASDQGAGLPGSAESTC